MFYYAVAKAIEFELIGEAANHVSAMSRARLAWIDWEQIVGMRHHLVHDFHRIDLDKIWDTVVNDIPVLIPQLEAALAQHDC